MVQRRLTVLQLLPAMEAGGVERGTVEVGAELVRRGHRALVVAASGRLTHELDRYKIEHIDWSVGKKSLTTLRYVAKLRQLLKREQVDILHARSRLPAWIGYWAWRGMDPGTRPRFVTTVHGMYSVNRYSRIMTFGERVIAVSESVRAYITKYYPKTDASRIVVIPRGVDSNIYRYGHRPSAAWSQTWYKRYPHLLDRFVLTLPGRLTRLKGHEDFIELMARLIALKLPVHGLIVGGEDPRRRSYAQELHEQIERRGLQGAITFTGARNDMREVYASSNLVFSLSNKPESFGRTVLEALSLGIPVLGYDHGGVGEILGKVFPAGRVPLSDLDALTERVQEFVNKMPIVPAGHPYALERMLDATMTLYENLTKRV